MSKRARLLHVIVQPVVVYDDGESLEMGPVISPQPVLARDLSGLEERLNDELERLFGDV